MSYRAGNGMDWMFRQDVMPGLGGLEAMKSPSPLRPSPASSTPRSEHLQMGVLRELVRRYGAVKGSAGVRADAVKECALERVSAVRGRVGSAGSAATSGFLLARNRVKLWWVNKAKARASRAASREVDKKIFELESLLENEEYELSLVEYRQWRIEQALFKHHDISVRMDKMKLLGPNAFRPPPPVRIFPEGTVILPPKRPLEKNFSNYLKSTEQYSTLFGRAVHVLFVRPITTAGIALGTVCAGMEAYEELKTPGTFQKHVHKLSSIFMARGSKVKEEADEEDKAT